MTLSRRSFVAAGAAALASAGAPRFALSATAGLAPVRPALLRADLEFLVRTMLAVGVDPFVSSSRAGFEAELARVRREIAAPMDVFGFYLRVARLFASLNDGHLSVTAFAAFKKYRDLGGLGFPLQVELRANGAFAAETDHPAIPAGSKLLAIDGTSSDQIVDGTLGILSGQSRALRLAFADPSDVRRYLLAKDGPRRSFAITALRPGGSVVSVIAAATTNAQLAKTLVARPPAAATDYTFARIANERVGYLDYRACENLATFKTFLHATFVDIANRPIAGLVVDVRSNRGGDSRLNDVLWGYLTGKAFAQSGGAIERSSDLVKKTYGKAKYVDVYGIDAWNAKDGALIRVPATPHRPAPNPLRYHGKVYLLVGPGTFSSAMACAVAAKDFGLATVVGEETIEPVNSNGGVFSGVAPHTKLEFNFPTQFWFGPKPRPNGQGLVPDVTVRTTGSDVANHRDPVLLYAVAQILGLVPM